MADARGAEVWIYLLQAPSGEGSAEKVLVYGTPARFGWPQGTLFEGLGGGRWK